MARNLKRNLVGFNFLLFIVNTNLTISDFNKTDEVGTTWKSKD